VESDGIVVPPDAAPGLAEFWASLKDVKS